MNSLTTKNSLWTGDKKKLLKSQVFNLSEQLKVALDTKKETKQPCSQRQERDIIQNILEERAEFFAQRVIVGDIKSFSARVGGGLSKSHSLTANMGLIWP